MPPEKKYLVIQSSSPLSCAAAGTAVQGEGSTGRFLSKLLVLLEKVNRSCAVLCCAVLCCAVLCCAVLCCAVLCCAVLM